MLLLVAGAVTAAVVMFGRQKLKEIEQITEQVKTATSGLAAAKSGPTCAKAIACCKAIVTKSAGGALAANCEALKIAPESACQQALQGYAQSAASLGVTCDTATVDAGQ